MTDIVPLNRAEVVALDDCERVIGEGIKSFVSTGSALTFVRDNRLYRATHASFEAYCRERWNLTPQHANRLALAAGVITSMEPMGSIPAPTSERQARELARVPEADRADVWSKTRREHQRQAHRQGDPRGRKEAHPISRAVRRCGTAAGRPGHDRSANRPGP